MPYTVASLTRQRPEGNPLLSASAPGRRVGLDLKYAVTPGPDAHGDGQPGLRPGRGGSGGREPVGVRDVLRRAPAVLRRRVRQLQLRPDCYDGPCSACSTRAASGARRTAPTTCRAATTSTPTTRRRSTILGAAKLTGRVGKFSVGALYAVTQEETATVVDGVARFQQAVEPPTSYSVGRVRREFANQSSIGFMVTATNRAADRATLLFLPEQRVTGGVDCRLALQDAATASPASWAGEQRERRPDGDRAHPAEQPPLLSASRRRHRSRSIRRARR